MLARMLARMLSAMLSGGLYQSFPPASNNPTKRKGSMLAAAASIDKTTQDVGVLTKFGWSSLALNPPAADSRGFAFSPWFRPWLFNRLQPKLQRFQRG